MLVDPLEIHFLVYCTGLDYPVRSDCVGWSNRNSFPGVLDLITLSAGTVLYLPRPKKIRYWVSLIHTCSSSESIQNLESLSVAQTEYVCFIPSILNVLTRLRICAVVLRTCFNEYITYVFARRGPSFNPSM